jgi:glucans biosynthesis protein C
MDQINSGRRYDLDWLRVIAILLLLFYHTGLVFNTWEWHIKNNETSGLFSYWMLPLHYIRMPLLLFISGAGTYMALGKRTVSTFVGERFKRLIIPFLAGLLLFGPLMVYFEYQSQFNSFWDSYKSVFDFIPYHDGNFNFYHLWFIGYLFVYSIIIIPILTFLRSPRSDGFKTNGLRILLHPIGIISVPVAFILLTQFLLRPNFASPPEGWAFFVFYFCFFLFGLVCYSSSNVRDSLPKNRKYLLVASVIALAAHFATKLFKGDNHLTAVAIEVTSILISWIWVVAIIAYGQYYMNLPGKFLTKMTEGAYPFYILHQPVLFVIAYYICSMPWSITAKYLSLWVLTLVTSITLYLVFVRPFNMVRFLFGMKPKPPA